jgi:hypothetical protein
MKPDYYNLHGLFMGGTATALIQRLEVDGKTQGVLESALIDIRNCLRPALKRIAIEAGVAAEHASPQFRFQGSSVYKTQNAPAFVPDQQVDVDMGVYLSAAFLDTAGSQGANGKRLPAASLAKTYFSTVDQLLKELCEEKGWKYAEAKKQKDTCCRIDLSPAGVHAHIDVPLYAAPNEQFSRALTKSVAFAMDHGMIFEAARYDWSQDLDDTGWDELDTVVMAKRTGEWEESDIQVVILHFRNASARIGHPFILRRMWRFVKAWRDQTWRNGGGPSSILLMECVVRVVEADGHAAEELFQSGRDDKLLRHIFGSLHRQLLDDVSVQWGSEPEDLNPANPETRLSWAMSAQACATAFERAITDAALTVGQAISVIREKFGGRISTDEDLVKRVVVVAAPFIATPARAQPNPQERVRRTGGA